MAKYIQCDCCGAPATVHLTQIINGVTNKINLCESCAHAKGILDNSGQPTLIFFEATTPFSKMNENSFLGSRCENCGWTQKQFETTKRLGCSDCYGTFHEAIEAVLKNVQRDLVHRGKQAQILVKKDLPEIEEKPTKKAEKPSHKRKTKAEQIKSLEAQLKLAIAEERYEDAIQLRDQIQKLKQRRQPKSQ